MARNSCKLIRPKLSAFFDDEMPREAAKEVAAHVEVCESCRAELDSYRALSISMQEASAGEPPSGIWGRIERELMPPSLSLATPTGNQGRQLPIAAGIISLAASTLILVGAGVWYQKHPVPPGTTRSSLASHSHDGSSSSEHAEDFILVMDDYLRILPEDPERAGQMLRDAYQGRLVSGPLATQLVGYRPLVTGGLPEGYTVDSTSVLRMPCCTCVKAVCRRSDGSTLVLFEHDDEETAWFGERPTSMATCGDKECCLVDLEESIAATWKQGSRSVTAIGVRDQSELARLVDWMQSVRVEG